MSAYKEFTGKTVEEAIRAAREEFGVELGGLDFEILTPGSRGVLGMGAEPARIVAAPLSALGGAAPKRDAAAATPLPPPSRVDHGPGDDRGPRRDDRGPRRDDRPRDDRGPRRDDRGPRRDDRPRDDRPQEDRPPRDDRPREDREPVAGFGATPAGFAGAPSGGPGRGPRRHPRRSRRPHRAEGRAPFGAPAPRQPDAVAADGRMDKGPRRRRGLPWPARTPASGHRQSGGGPRPGNRQDAPARADAGPRAALDSPRAARSSRRRKPVDCRGAEPSDCRPAARRLIRLWRW